MGVVEVYRVKHMNVQRRRRDSAAGQILIITTGFPDVSTASVAVGGAMFSRFVLTIEPVLRKEAAAED